MKANKSDTRPVLPHLTNPWWKENTHNHKGKYITTDKDKCYEGKVKFLWKIWVESLLYIV